MAISTTFDSLAELARVGLIVRRYGRVELAALSLDDIAERHALKQVWDARLTAHQTARMLWRHWLETRQQPPTPPPPTVTEPDPRTYRHYNGDADDLDHYLSIVLATGPPVADPIP